MAKLVASYQVGAFITPVNATPIDADPVRGNDNTLRSALNNHDADAGIHLQSSTLAERPVAGTLDRKWLTTDDRRIWVDDGSSWQEIAYLPSGSGPFAPLVSPTFTGTVTVPGIQSSQTTWNLVGSGSNGMIINASNASGIIAFYTANTNRWSINASGHLVPAADVAHDIGISGTNRVRIVYCQTVDAATNMKVNNLQVLSSRSTGWTANPTGTLDRTTFVSDSVTLVELAKRVAALIVDLRAHGLIGA